MAFSSADGDALPALLALLQVSMRAAAEGSSAEHGVASTLTDGDASPALALAHFAPFAPALVTVLAAAESTATLVRATACLYALHCVAGAPPAAVPAVASASPVFDTSQSALLCLAAHDGAVSKLVTLAASLVDVVVKNEPTGRDVNGDVDGDDAAACWAAICWVCAVLARLRNVFSSTGAAEAAADRSCALDIGKDAPCAASAVGAGGLAQCAACAAGAGGCAGAHLCALLWKRSASALLSRVRTSTRDGTRFASSLSPRVRARCCSEDERVVLRCSDFSCRLSTLLLRAAA